MTTPYGGGGFVNNLLGGVMGTMAGTNPLQSSVDQLTNAINRLTTAVGAGTIGAGNRVGQQQGQTAAGGFPPVNVPGMNRQAGIGGGGPGGTGNVRPPAPFGRLGVGLAGGIMLGGAFAGYGQQQMPFQLGLNAMATQSMLGMSGMNSGMGNFAPTFSQLANQGGLPISSNGMDYLQMTQGLQFLGGSPMFRSTALGRAGFGAAAAFGMTNPALSGAASASLAQQIYNPNLSMRMRMLGYNTTPRVMGSGMPQSIGNISASLIQGWYGKSRVNPAQLYKTLSMGGRGFTNLQYLGLNPQQMAPLLEGFNQLFNAGYTPQAASDMFSRAASSNPNISRPAQAALTRAGVRTVSSDIQKLKNAQAPVTQRSINTAAGFDAALTSSTDLLQRFNQVLNSILNTTGMNGPLGALGGSFGVMSGTNHGNFLQGLGGLGLIGLAARGAFGGGGGLLGGLGGGATGGMLGRLGLAGGAGALGLGAAGAAGLFATQYHFGNQTLWQRGSPGSGGHMTGWNSWSGLGNNISNWTRDWLGGVGGTLGRIFGGASGGVLPQSSQGKSRSMNTGSSSAAMKAVSSAESQIGVPYVWGGEQPGVGFDCSGLVQWAYKQAGVALPRTSEQQYSALIKKSVPMNQVQAGDIVFAAGSDGTPNNPGHEGLMINSRQLIQAPHTGADVQIIGYNPRDWSHAARPTGRANLGVSGILAGQNAGASTSPGLYGNTGSAMGGMGFGSYGSSNEVDLISVTGGFMGFGGGFSAGGLGGVMSTNTGGSKAGSTMGRGTPMGNGSKQIAAEKAFAMQLLKARGWGNQFGAIDFIANHESGWRWNATNPTSHAYGIPQALPGSKMAVAGRDWLTNPDTQLRWMIDTYIPQRYGTPNNAMRFWQQNGWYSGGAKSPMQGWSWVGERGPELMFTGGGNSILNNAQSLALMKAVTNQPAQSPWQNLSGTMQYQGKVIHPGMPSIGGANITVNFTKGSVNVNMPAGSSTDVQSIGKALAQQTVQHMERELINSTIAKGIKN